MPPPVPSSSFGAGRAVKILLPSLLPHRFTISFQVSPKTALPRLVSTTPKFLLSHLLQPAGNNWKPKGPKSLGKRNLLEELQAALPCS